jgi:STE24 endopeptidase
MKTLIPTIAAVFLVLFVLTTFVPYPAARQTALEAGFTTEQIDTGLQYSFERRLLSWGWIALKLTILCALGLTSLGRRLADRFLAWTGGRRILAALCIALVIALIEEVLWLPIAIGRHYHTVAWGLSNRGLDGWFRDHIVGMGIYFVQNAIILVGFYALVIYLPRSWWLAAPILGGALGAGYALLLPIVRDPMFNDFTPLSETKWQHLQPRIKALFEEAGVPVQEILVMDASRQSKHSNAYFTGFGPTRRIVLYDNLLKRPGDESLLEKRNQDQLISILGHEIGHWRHDHIVKGILLAMPAALLGFFLLDRLLRFAVGRAPWQLQSTADPAGLPIILLAVYLGTWAALPVQNTVGRYFETQADQSALDLARQPNAFVDAELEIANDNKTNVAPTPWNTFIFNDHPAPAERIRMAKEWSKQKGSKN